MLPPTHTYPRWPVFVVQYGFSIQSGIMLLHIILSYLLLKRLFVYYLGSARPLSWRLSVQKNYRFAICDHICNEFSHSSFIIVYLWVDYKVGDS